MRIYDLLLSVLIFSFLIPINGQSYLGYRFLNTEFGVYNEISGGIISSATGDDGAENITLPFLFEYMGITYSNARISVNGWLEMGQTYNGYGYENELESNVKKPLICPLWDDLFADSLSEIRYEVLGSYPARMFVIQWKNMRWRDFYDLRKNFQIRLWELDNTIDFIYGSGSSDFGYPTYSIGLNNNIGGIGNFISVTPLTDGNYLTSDSIANNYIEDFSLLQEGLMLSFVPSIHNIYGFSYEPTIVFQPPHYVTAGYPYQYVIVIIIPCHAGDVLTSPWVTKFYFNTFGTTNTLDILNAKLFYTGSNPNFTIQYQLGQTVSNPSNIFNIGGFTRGLINNNVSYFWLTYDISANAVNGNYIDGNCYLIELEGCCPSIAPDSSLASSHCVITGGIPVELNSFTSLVNNNIVTLNWTTSTETNNQGFQIERRKTQDERREEWQNIGFVNGMGTTTEPQSYSFVDEALEADRYQFRLKQIDFDGTFEYSKSIEVEIGAPTKFSLEQNYPNPFNPRTVIRFNIPNVISIPTSRERNLFVSLKIYDVLGNEIATLVNEEKPAGSYEVEFNLPAGRQGPSSGIKNPASGIYFYQLKAGDFVDTKKMLLIK